MFLSEVQRVLRLVGEAIREEVRLRRMPPESPPAPEPVRDPLPSGRVYTRCIACAAALDGEHAMLCTKCIDDRARWARERENPRPRRGRRKAGPSPSGGEK